MEGKQVRCKIENGVMTITIDNPAMKNGTNYRGVNELADCFERLIEDDSIKVAVFTGSGEYFWTGGRVDPNAPGENEKYANGIERFENLRKKNEKPIIAAVNGHCLKAGMGMLCSADIAVAKKGVEFGLPEVRMGGVPMMVMAEVMDYMPQKLAMEAFITCWNFSAEDAYRIGLVNRIVDESEFDATVQKYVDVYLNTPAELIRLTKKAYREMSKLSTLDERTSFAMEMLRNEVLPAMKTIKQEYNV